MSNLKLLEMKPTLCKSLYGFADFEFCIDFIESAFELEFKEPVTLNGELSKVEQNRSIIELIISFSSWISFSSSFCHLEVFDKAPYTTRKKGMGQL